MYERAPLTPIPGRRSLHSPSSSFEPQREPGLGEGPSSVYPPTLKPNKAFELPHGTSWPKERDMGWLIAKHAPVPDLPPVLRPMQPSLNHVWVELERQHIIKNRYILAVWTLTITMGCVGALTTALAQFPFGHDTASAFGVITAVCALMSGFLRERGQPELAKRRYLALRKIYFQIENAFYCSDADAMRTALREVDEQVVMHMNDTRGDVLQRADEDTIGLNAVAHQVSVTKKEMAGVVGIAKDIAQRVGEDFGRSKVQP